MFNNVEELKKYLITDQGLEESEAENVIEFYNVQDETVGGEDDWEVDYIQNADDWVEDIFDSISSEYGDVGSFLKLHYISDTSEFASEYAEYLLDDGSGFIVYCDSTNNVVVFK